MNANSIEQVAGEVETHSKSARRVTVIHPPSFSPLIVFTGLSRLQQHLDLLWTLIVHRLKVRYKQSVLGPAWAVVQPLFLMLIYTVIFSRIARVETGDIPYPIFAYTALLPWTAFSSALTAATGGVTSHADLVKKVYFPREILPLSYIAAALVDLMIASIVLWGLFLYYGVQLTIFALWGLPIIAVMIAFVAAVSLMLSAVQVRFRDIGMAMPLLLQLWMFATPVVYPLRAVPEQWRAIYMLNPMVGVIENFRRVMLEGIAPDYVSLGTSLVVSIILLPLTYMYFKHLEATMADVI